jgi:hypothetical protein
MKPMFAIVAPEVENTGRKAAKPQSRKEYQTESKSPHQTVEFRAAVQVAGRQGVPTIHYM